MTIENNTDKNINMDTENRKSDFEKYIEDSLEDADMQPDEEMDEGRLKEVKNRQEQKTESLKPSARQIADIISQNELIEEAKQERVRALLEKQIRVYERKSEILDRLEKEMKTLKSKRRVARAALKKAKEQKLDKDVTRLIKTDIGYIDEATDRCKEMIRTGRKEIKKIGSLINLLDSAT